MFTRSLLLHTATASLVAAQSRNYSPIIAAGTPYGDANTNNGGASDADRQRFAQANQNPNVTASFDFNPFYLDGTFNMGSNAQDLENTWTLRVNVSDFAVPDAEPMYPSEQDDYVEPHITNTVLELDWGTNESFRSALNGSNSSVCVSVTTGNFLPNITNRFTADNTDGDCTPVLGEACTQAILTSRQSGSTDQCNFELWESLPECASTLGASRSYDQYGLSRLTWNMNGNSSARNASFADIGYEAVANGTDGRYGFFSQTSEVYNAANETVYEAEATKLRITLLSITPYQGQFGLIANTALCVRADARELEVPEDESTGGGGDDGGDGDDGSGDSSSEGGDGEEGEGNAASTMVPGATLALVGAWLGVFSLL